MTNIPTVSEHDQIAILAHQIYESTGFPQGCADAHWKQAQEILQKRKAHSTERDHKPHFSDEVFSN
ncbi:MAG: DUF2934 domain-containing protein [Chthoniobacterales bacterium]